MNEYVLNININKNGEDAVFSDNITPPSAVSDNNGGNAANKIISATAKLQALGLAKQVFKYQMGMVGVRQGNSDLQEKIDFSMNTAGKIAAIAGAFIVNPIIGGLALLSEGIGIAQRYDTYYTYKRWDDIGLAQERLRAGASYNRSRGGQGGY